MEDVPVEPQMGGYLKLLLFSKPLTGITTETLHCRLQEQDKPTVMVDLPAYFPYFSTKGFTIFFCATICMDQDKR